MGIDAIREEKANYIAVFFYDAYCINRMLSLFKNQLLFLTNYYLIKNQYENWNL